MLNFYAEIETKTSLFSFPVNSNNNWYNLLFQNRIVSLILSNKIKWHQ